MQVSGEPLRANVERRAHSYPEGRTKSSIMRGSSKTRLRRKRKGKKLGHNVSPIILAAGRCPGLGFPQALARFGERTAVSIAIDNCGALGRPIVVLGHAARQILPFVPRGVGVVVHRGWQAGQLSSLRAGLQRVPKGSPFLLYPVDYPLLTRRLVQRLVHAFLRRRAGKEIALPVNRGRRGHPVVFSPAVRREFARTRSAREIVEKDRLRVKEVQVNTAAIWKDFDTPDAYRRRLLELQRGGRL